MLVELICMNAQSAKECLKNGLMDLIEVFCSEDEIPDATANTQGRAFPDLYVISCKVLVTISPYDFYMPFILSHPRVIRSLLKALYVSPGAYVQGSAVPKIYVTEQKKDRN